MSGRRAPAVASGVLTEEGLHRLSGALRTALAHQSGADAALSRSARRAAGVFFTPEPLVRFVTAGALDTWLARNPDSWRGDGSPRATVLDPAAGDGRFLAAAVAHLAQAAERRGYDPARARRAITERCVVGLERDSALAAVARDRLGAGAQVHCCEALLGTPVGFAGADVVVGNPPYLRSINFAETDPELWRAIRGRYAATSHGEWDLYAAFLEQALEWTRPGGEVGFVVPSRWLTARFAAKLRAKLSDGAAVRALVDFGAEQVFAGATTYASVAFLSRVSHASVHVARRRDGVWQCGDVPASSLGSAPWRLSVGRRRALLERLGAAGPRLGDVVRIAKGAGTNADGVYVLEHARQHGDVVRGRSRELDREVAVEARLARLCLRGRDVRAFAEPDPSVRCVVPYTRAGDLIEPGELERTAPLTYAYLLACRERLDARERGRFRGETFYRFGRPQNMAFLGDASPKLVIPDVARGGRALEDTGGAMVLDSAYAMRLTDERDDMCISLVLAIFNSPMVALWLRETGVPLRGGYVRLKTAYLASLPMPAPSPARDQIAHAMAARVSPDEIAELVRVAYDVAPEDWSGSSPSSTLAT